MTKTLCAEAALSVNHKKITRRTTSKLTKPLEDTIIEKIGQKVDKNFCKTRCCSDRIAGQLNVKISKAA